MHAAYPIGPDSKHATAQAETGGQRALARSLDQDQVIHADLALAFHGLAVLRLGCTGDVGQRLVLHEHLIERGHAVTGAHLASVDFVAKLFGRASPAPRVTA